MKVVQIEKHYLCAMFTSDGFNRLFPRIWMNEGTAKGVAIGLVKERPVYHSVNVIEVDVLQPKKSRVVYTARKGAK